MSLWNDISTHLKKGENLCLLVVTDSIGSSPGRKGFKMFVTESGTMGGSIGGGFMEQKLVELAKFKLAKRNFEPFQKKQIHRKDVAKDQSGMICSGEQTVAFYYLNSDAVSLVENILEQEIGTLTFTDKQIHFNKEPEETTWFSEPINTQPTVHIIGGGHVGLALSQTMKQLDFRVVVMDNREGLQTMQENEFADKLKVVNYETIENDILKGENSYVVLVSFGFRTDEQVLRRLIDKDYKYLGLMGSKEKIKQLLANLKSDGYSEEMITKVRTPIGLPIHSKTPAEIAISIAAEIVGVKNG